MPFNRIKNILDTMESIKEFTDEAAERFEEEIDGENVESIIERIPNPHVRSNLESLVDIVDKWKNR